MLGLGSSLVTGGASSDWTPADLGSKLKAWYKYNTGISSATVSGNLQVTQWADQSGNDNHLEPTVTNDKDEMPRLLTDGLSSEALVFFNSNTDSLVFTSAVTLGKFAMYWKSNWKDTIASEVIFEGDNDNFVKLQSPTEMRLKAGGDVREDATIPEVTDDESTPHILGMERAANGSLLAYNNNVAQDSWASSGDKDGRSPIANALEITQMGDAQNPVYYYEVVICDDVLSTAERNLLYTWLQNQG